MSKKAKAKVGKRAMSKKAKKAKKAKAKVGKYPDPRTVRRPELVWDEEMFTSGGKPKRNMGPEGWFAYCVKKSGNINRLAIAMGVSRQTVYASWRGVFPDKYVVQAEETFGIPRRYLAPHLYE